MKVYPEMLMKTKEGVLGVRFQVSGIQVQAGRQADRVEILPSDSCLLTCVLKNEGASGDIHENKGRRHFVPAFAYLAGVGTCFVTNRAGSDASQVHAISWLLLWPGACLRSQAGGRFGRGLPTQCRRAQTPAGILRVRKWWWRADGRWPVPRPSSPPSRETCATGRVYREQIPYHRGIRFDKKRADARA